MKLRDPNTDLIRASAIAMVLIHHVGQNLTLLPEPIHRFLSLGAYGVDLFFVLSGWLIGGLYWRERSRSGKVNLVRFWLRRWIRTIPPYAAVLPIAFLAVYFYRGESFDWRYLLFLQNYEENIPFFLASWSLCVEEHFYLFLPLILGLFSQLKFPMHAALPMLVFISVIARFVDPAALPDQVFGYASTASHLRFEGLAIGVWFAYLSIYQPIVWAKFQRVAIALRTPLLLGFLTIPFWSSWTVYYLGTTYVALVCAAVLGSFTAMSEIRIAGFQITYYLALGSYSIYLTHGIVLNVCVLLTDKLHLVRESVFPIWFILILLAGFVMHYLVERPAILLRDRVAPK